MISVIVPVHNVKKYMIQCLESIQNQTYKNLEIICVDSSDDGTTEILADYARKHQNLVHVIDENNSYGYKINYGITHAKGEYLGIIDADDWIQPDMYEELLAVLLREDVDFVKSDYYQFYTEKGRDLIKEYTGCLGVAGCYSKKISILDYPEILYRKGMSIWTGLYKTFYLREKGVHLNESEGASFQDTGFSVLSHLMAKAFYYYPKAFYMYRIDNTGSSVKSSAKYRTVADEWKWIEDKVSDTCRDSRLREALKYDKLRSYWWNCMRLNETACEAFCGEIAEELYTEFIPSGQIQKMPWDLREMFETVYEKAAAFKAAKEEKMNIKISVVIPAFNVQSYIGECVESLIQQNVNDLEIICVDDCSTDGTWEILKQYEKKYEQVKIYRNEKNEGLAKTRNVGIEKAAGHYMLFVDSDDTLKSGAVDALIQHVQKYHADIILFDAECRFEMEEIKDQALEDYYHREVSYAYSTGRDILSRMIMNNELCDSACLMMVRANWLKETGILFEEGMIYEDCIFVTDCLLKDCTVFHTNMQYYVYRIRKGSIMRSRMRAENVYSRICCLKKIWKHLLEGDLTDTLEEALVKWSGILYYSTKKIRSELSVVEEVRLHEMKLRPVEKMILQQAEKENNQECPKELYDFVKEIHTYSKYQIYGAGRWAKRLISFLDSQGMFDKIETMLVSSLSNNPESVYGIPVSGISWIQNLDEDTIIIIAVRGDDQIQIKKLLAEKGIWRVVCLDDQIVWNFHRH